MTNAPLASSEAHNPPADSGLEPLRGLLAPRLWPSWLMLGVLRASALLPAGVALALGRVLGLSLGRMLRYRRQVTVFHEIIEEADEPAESVEG